MFVLDLLLAALVNWVCSTTWVRQGGGRLREGTGDGNTNNGVLRPHVRVRRSACRNQKTGFVKPYPQNLSV